MIITPGLRLYCLDPKNSAKLPCVQIALATASGTVVTTYVMPAVSKPCDGCGRTATVVEVIGKEAAVAGE